MYLRHCYHALGLAILLWSPVSRGSDSIKDLLQQAEQVRSSDPIAYKRILASLNAEGSHGTRLQQQQIAYLNAYAMTFSGNLDGSIREAREVMETTDDVNLRFRAGALIVNNYALNGHYNEGLRQLERTLSLIDRINDPELREHGLISAALLYNQIGQYQLGTQFADRVLASSSSQRAACFASYLKFDGLQKLGTLPKEDAPLEQAIRTCEERHETVMANLVRATLARKWVAEDRRDQAIALLQSHLRESQATGYPRLIAEIRSSLATLLFEKGDIAGAKENAVATANQSAGIENTPPVVSAFLTLYKIANQNGNIGEALTDYKRYAEAERGYLGEVKARELAYHLVRQEEQYKNQQIELLNRQNNLLQLQQQVDQQAAANSRLYMLFFALLAATISFWAYKTKRMQMSVKRMAEVDALTDISNRNHFTVQSERTLQKCMAAGEPVSLLMFDLDYFKSINDNYGHVTGDWVLKRVAAVCGELCRGIDHLGRIGGEEFAILLHGCDLKAATRVAEDCRVRLSRIDPLPSGYRFPISASFGVSASSTSGYDLDKLLSHADQMLYRAKREGRNRVRAFVAETSAELPGIHFAKDSRPVIEPGETSVQDSLRA